MKPSTSDLLKKYNIRLKKSLGQNLLLDPNINRKMTEVAGLGPADIVFEVGAGTGELTELIAGRARTVLTVETDSRFEPLLHERFEQNSKVIIFIGDILKHPVKELVDRFLPEATALKMVSNLPYYITSPVLMHFLESEAEFVSLTVMIQKEVAERIVAEPGGKDYGILSIACQLYARPFVAHAVSANCFRPRPKVDSAIVHFPIRKDMELDPGERQLLFKIVRAAFGQRRKKLVNALAPLAGSALPGKEALPQLLEQCGIRPDSRAEIVPVEAFIRLATLAAPGESRQG